MQQFDKYVEENRVRVKLLCHTLFHHGSLYAIHSILNAALSNVRVITFVCLWGSLVDLFTIAFVLSPQLFITVTTL